jgi:hypothetical protein
MSVSMARCCGSLLITFLSAVLMLLVSAGRLPYSAFIAEVGTVSDLPLEERRET